MQPRELICSEIYGGNGSVSTELILPGLRGYLYSRACGGGKGGDVYYASACAAGVISRICLADVAGHGEQVAQVGAWLHGTMRRNMGQTDPARVFTSMNERASLFGIEALTTAVCLSYDMSRAMLRFCYAGHPPALICRRGERDWRPLAFTKESPGSSNIPFGVADDVVFDTGRLNLNESDRIFLYSDGLTEAHDITNNQFGVERLRETLRQAGDASPDELTRSVESALRDHVGMQSTHDDVTFVTLEAGPRTRAPKVWHFVRNHTRKTYRRSDQTRQV